jgi:ribosomal protein S18 acetylase RimI-like enzyme
LFFVVFESLHLFDKLRMTGELCMHVRTFQLSDYYALTELLKNSLSDDCYDDTIKALTNQLSWDCDLVLLAELENNIVGFIIGTIDDQNGYCYRIAVESKYQRKGIGKLLLETLKQRFMQRKVKKIMVTVDTHNEVLIPFYRSAGYVPSDFSHAAERLSIVKHA